MKIKLRPENLLKATTMVSSVSQGGVLEFQSLIRIEAIKRAGRKFVVLQGSNIQESFFAVVEDPLIAEVGEAQVNMKQFHQIALRLKDNKEVEITTDKVMKIISGDIKLSLSLSSSNFPKFDEKELGSLELSNDEFSSIVTKVAPFCSMETYRPQLTGVFFHQTGDSLVSVATDGLRLSKLLIPCGWSIPKIIILPSTLKLVKKFSDKGVKIHIFPNYAKLSFGSSAIYTRLIDREYISYDNVIPDKSGMNRISVNRDELLRAVSILQIVADTTVPKGVFKIGSEELIVTTESESGVSQGHIKVPMSIDNELGEETEIGLNLAYMSDILRILDDEVSIYFTNPVNPLIIQSNESNLLLLMPIRIDNEK